MATSLIIGSGPAAAGAALALTADPANQVTVVDVGTVLEGDHQAAMARLAATPEAAWSSDDLARIGLQPVPSRRGVLPEKRAHGSDYPFRDVGQLAGVDADGPANDSVVSGAYGGFSNVWGAQLMPFSRATFDRWPISMVEMEPHYRTALGEMTLAGEEDDLAELFPLLAPARPLPPPSERTERVLERYAARQALVQSHGITLGRARLAFKADECTRCGLCMTGCPYELIYSSSHTFDRLRAENRVTYRSGLLALRLGEVDGVPHVVVRDTRTGRVEQLTADRIFVACGGIGTTRLVLGSLGLFDHPIFLEESVQFVVPAVSMRPVRDPRLARNFTLNQFNLLYDASGDGVDLCQVHFYDYNPAFLGSLPGILRAKGADPALAAVLRRVSVGLGYVPGWASPRVKVVARQASGGDEVLPRLEIGRESDDQWPPMLRELVAAMRKVAPALDLWPVIPMISMSAAAKSYHFGSSFPHARTRGPGVTDRAGRLAAWDRIHLVDASVFPNVPATTFTLTIMANAHRIATEAAGEGWVTGAPRLVGITGATGYLGSVLVDAFGSAGYEVRRLVRSPAPGTGDRAFALGAPPDPDALDGLDVLIHCAYDMALTKRADIWQSNVYGTVALFDQALASGVRRTIALSSMSAYPGTRQHYGRAKLAVEVAARGRGLSVVRPGLVYGPQWGGMAGTLRRLSGLPVVPDFGPAARQFTVDERDFAAAMIALADAERLPSLPVGIAHPDVVPFAELLALLAASAGSRPPRFVPVPPMVVYTVLRVAERLPIPLPVRADSLLGLVRPAPSVPHLEVLDQLGVALRPFALESVGP